MTPSWRCWASTAFPGDREEGMGTNIIQSCPRDGSLLPFCTRALLVLTTWQMERQIQEVTSLGQG